MSTPIIDLVTERSRCAPHVVFNDLVEMIQDDVKTANSLAAEEGTSFEFRKLPTGAVVVTRAGSSFFTRIELKGPAITFVLMSQDDTKREVPFSVTPSLNEKGQRVLMLDGKPYEFWQIRQKALEPVFFG